jgi:hypothetical protein
MPLARMRVSAASICCSSLRASRKFDLKIDPMVVDELDRVVAG